MSNKLEEEIKERLHTRTLTRRVADVSGSCISSGFCYEIDNDKKIFVKVNGGLHARTMFDGEFESLKQINATKTIRVPKPISLLHNYDGLSKSAIVMEFLEIRHLSADCAPKLGQALAALHSYNSKVIKYNKKASGWIGQAQPSARRIIEKRDEDQDEEETAQGDDEWDGARTHNIYSKHGMTSSGGSKQNKQSTTTGEADDEYPVKFIPEPDTQQVDKFGFDVPTSCGSIPQSNEWTDDWVSFYARHRLDTMIRMILADHSDRDLNEQWSHLQLKVNKYFTDYQNKGDDKIVPALLHGDLWSGNIAELSDGSDAATYDPASFYGHFEYDFGIARMFGGFPRDFERTYFEIVPKKRLFEKRNKLYQLFHHLNHWAHFGQGYRSSSLRLIKDLNVLV